VRSRSAYIRKPYAARTPPGKQKFIETEMEAKPIYFSPPYPFDVVSQDLSEIEDSGCSVDTFSGSEEEEERAEVSSGKVVYFGGPIGAGKTFLMELVEKSLRDSGVDVSVFREPIERTDLGVFYTRSEEGPVVDQRRRYIKRGGDYVVSWLMFSESGKSHLHEESVSQSLYLEKRAGSSILVMVETAEEYGIMRYVDPEKEEKGEKGEGFLKKV